MKSLEEVRQQGTEKKNVDNSLYKKGEKPRSLYGRGCKPTTLVFVLVYIF